MQTKKTASVVASEPAAQAVLRRGATRELTPDEERVLRMRLGAVPPRTAPLERSLHLAGGPGEARPPSPPEARTDLEIELLAAEVEAHLRWREHQRELLQARAVAPRASRSKEKIIRALRKKV